jgi:hypothetical protein
MLGGYDTHSSAQGRDHPVTPLQQNCCLIWCTQTMRGAFTDRAAISSG